MGTEELLAVVDPIRANFGQESAMGHEILEDILDTLQHRTSRGSVAKIPVSTLLELQAVLPGSTLLEDMLSATLAPQLPPGSDGQIVFADGQPLSAVLSGTKPTRLSEPRTFPSDFISRLFEKETWTESTASTIVTLLYSTPTSSNTNVAWLNSKRWRRLASHTFAPVLAAFLDCTALTGGDLSQVNDDVLHGLLKQLFPGDRGDGSRPTRHLECIHRILELSGSRRTRLVSALEECIQSIPVMDFAFETTCLARKLLGVSGCGALTTSIVDRALQWAVRHLSGDVADSEDSNLALENLSGWSRVSFRLFLIE